jgi:hypothetical protein
MRMYVRKKEKIDDVKPKLESVKEFDIRQTKKIDNNM